MTESVCVGIDCNVQPILFVIDSNHRLVKRDVIRGCTVCRPYICFQDPIVDGFSTTLTPNLSNYRTVFESDSPAK
jgi:hypothetical protein